MLNLSQQTDSSDLLGGFRPVQPRDALLPLLARLQARPLLRCRATCGLLRLSGAGRSSSALYPSGVRLSSPPLHPAVLRRRNCSSFLCRNQSVCERHHGFHGYLTP